MIEVHCSAHVIRQISCISNYVTPWCTASYIIFWARGGLKSLYSNITLNFVSKVVLIMLRNLPFYIILDSCKMFYLYIPYGDIKLLCSACNNLKEGKMLVNYLNSHIIGENSIFHIVFPSSFSLPLPLF